MRVLHQVSNAIVMALVVVVVILKDENRVF